MLIKLRALCCVGVSLEALQRVFIGTLGNDPGGVKERIEAVERDDSSWLFADYDSPSELSELSRAASVARELGCSTWVYSARFWGFDLDEITVHEVEASGELTPREDCAKGFENEWSASGFSGEQGEVVSALLQLWFEDRESRPRVLQPADNKPRRAFVLRRAKPSEK